MAPFPEEMEPYTFVFLTRDTVKRFGTMLPDALLLQVNSKFGVVELLVDLRVVKSLLDFNASLSSSGDFNHLTCFQRFPWIQMLV